MKNLLFVDIETVSQHQNYSELSERMKTHWQRKSSFMNHDNTVSEDDLYNEKAGIFAEFGKIIVIGLGFFAKDESGSKVFRVKSLQNSNEKELLEEFCVILKHFSEEDLQLCAHNGKEFDFPYLCRRMIINDIKLPYVLNTSGKKPWEVNHLDTMQMWKFGDYKHFTSLDLLASILGIESSKTDIDGSQVGNVYYQEGDLSKIAEYCKRDVAVTAQVYLKLNSIEGLKSEQIISVD